MLLEVTGSAKYHLTLLWALHQLPRLLLENACALANMAL